MKNKLFYYVTGILLCFTTLCSTAMAAADEVASPFPDVPATADYFEAVKTLHSMGIFSGDEKGNFNPDKTITRAEAAKVICLLLGVGNEAATMTKQVFSDVPSMHWAVGYVAKAAELEIIGGYGNGKFGPSDSVTYEQMVKMLVCAWGYGSAATGEGGWPSGYLYIAKSIGITESNVVNTAGPIARSIVAQLAYNTIRLSPYNEYDMEG